MARGLCYKPRWNVGRYPNGPMPEDAEPWTATTNGEGGTLFDRDYLSNVHYDLWLGPAPKRPFNPNRFHYNWQTYFGYEGEPGPNSEEITEDEEYDPMDLTGAGGGGHFANFIAAVRSGNREDLTCDIEVGRRSTALAHLGTISYRLERELEFDGDKEQFVDDDEAGAMLKREELAKPVLYPIYSSGGAPITRGYPIDPRPGERVDHPHHIGHWLNYGDVNGLDFWNNSGEVPEEERGEFGHIVHPQVEKTESGSGRGELEVQMDWRGPDPEDCPSLTPSTGTSPAIPMRNGEPLR